MKLRVLKYRISATHPLFTDLKDFDDPRSISDFDAFVLDPIAFQGYVQNYSSFSRRQNELQELIRIKGGIIVCVLRPTNTINVPGLAGNVHLYSILQQVSPAISGILGNTARLGMGSQAKLIRKNRGPSTEYLQVLDDDLSFVAHLDAPVEQIEQINGQVMAQNSVGHPIAVEFNVAEGMVCVVPMPANVPSDRMGAAIMGTIKSHFDNTIETDIPNWAAEIAVPGADAFELKIQTLSRDRDAIATEISQLEKKRDDLLSHKGLLYGYGKAVLESRVRSAFRLLGFDVPEPDSYRGEWDIEMRDPETGKTAIGEIEGSDGIVDVRKFRQLNAYVDDEALEERDHKGFLIGNGFRSTNPSAPEREVQFSPHALRGLERRNFCGLPCTELFKAVCVVLDHADIDGLKRRIRDSMLSTIGIWKFTEDIRNGIRGPERSA